MKSWPRPFIVIIVSPLPTDPFKEIVTALAQASPEVQRSVLAWLRERYEIHPLESEWSVPAEVILEAISRSPALSQRGVRGLIAEAYFDQLASAGIPGWEKQTISGNPPYDCLLAGEQQSVRIQVKMQRKRAGNPLLTRNTGKCVVETQRTRGGTRKGENTRPYRFGEFDILAVGMEPSTGDWTQFRFTLERWLIPDSNDSTQILKYQPVSLEPNDDWTDNLATAIQWFMSGEKKTIAP